LAPHEQTNEPGGSILDAAAMKERRTTERYTLADLENWPEAARDVDPPIRLGVFGDPVAHSLSPQIQNAALCECKIEMQYARFHIRGNELRSALRFLRKLDFIGINLTVPHKIAAFAQIDEVDERARRAGAVNMIRVRDKKLIGSNTDGEGFLRPNRNPGAIAGTVSHGLRCGIWSVENVFASRS